MNNVENISKVKLQYTVRVHKLFYITTLKTHDIRKMEATCKIVAVQSMKSYKQSRCIAPFILNLSTIHGVPGGMCQTSGECSLS